MTRVYAGTTLADVDRWRAAGVVPAGTSARAVTAEVVQALDDCDDEEREYAVTQLAAGDSLERLRERGGDRRVVLVAERADVQPGEEPGMVRITTDLPWRDVVAIMADEVSASDAVRVTIADPEALLDDRELAWFTPAEVDDLTRGDA